MKPHNIFKNTGVPFFFFFTFRLKLLHSASIQTYIDGYTGEDKRGKEKMEAKKNFKHLTIDSGVLFFKHIFLLLTH